MINKDKAALVGLLWAATIMVGFIFLMLKLIGIGLPSEWSWWIVLLPWYGPPVFLFFMWATLKALGVVLTYWADVMGNYAKELRRKRKEREREVGQRCNKCGEVFVGLAQDCGCTRGSC